MFVICFINIRVKRSKQGLFVFPPKKTLIWGRHCSISQLRCSMTSKRSIGWFLDSSRAWSFWPERSLNQPKATHVCIRLINQPNRSISVRLLFLFCSRYFISRSYENRPIMYSVVKLYLILFMKLFRCCHICWWRRILLPKRSTAMQLMLCLQALIR